jgi:hypothetical protein
MRAENRSGPQVIPRGQPTSDTQPAQAEVLPSRVAGSNQKVQRPVLEALVEQVRQGMSIRRAAAKTGISDRTVYRHAREDPAFAEVLRQANADGVQVRLAPHGTTGCYGRGCRCDACRAANARHHQRLRQQRALRAASAQFEHGLSAYKNWACRCEVCLKAKQMDNHALYLHDPKAPGLRTARRQARTLEQAKRHRYMWTGPELEIAARSDLTVQQIALMLGRTYYAVRGMRWLVRQGDPRKAFLAGLGAATRPGAQP